MRQHLVDVQIDGTEGTRGESSKFRFRKRDFRSAIAKKTTSREIGPRVMRPRNHYQAHNPDTCSRIQVTAPHPLSVFVIFSSGDFNGKDESNLTLPAPPPLFLSTFSQIDQFTFAFDTAIPFPEILILSALNSEERARMPKKMGVNSKAEAARGRKTASEMEKKEREAREKEEQYWREAEGQKSKAAKKREEEEQKRAEAAAKKAEARRLAELEEKEMEKSLKKPDKKVNRVSVPVPKVTEAELRRRREQEQLELQRRAEEAKKKITRTAEEEEYEKMVLIQNTNRDDSLIEAHSVDEAIAHMSIADNLPLDKHPEKRLKASFKAFEEAELPRLKAEKPGLTHTQYKDMIWKLWKKSPDNPLNRVAE